jgi:hypothetical protein
MPNFGTRTIATRRQLHPPGGSLHSSQNTDPGMSKRVTASITFGGGNATGATNTFAPPSFALWDTVEVLGANLNAGFFTVTGLDAVNAAYLTLDPPPKSEGPITVTIRTP